MASSALRLKGHWGKRDLWSPLVLSRSVLKAWWSADDLAASSVTTWTDRINAIAITATSTAIPTWSATGWTISGTSLGAAKAGVTADGVANCLVSTSITALPTGSVGGEIWTLFDKTSQATAAASLRYGTSSNSNSRGVGYTNVNASQVTDGTVNLTGPAAVGKSILGGMWSGTTESGRLNGSAFSSTGTISTLATGTTRLRMFASNSGSAANFAQGTLRHCLVTTGLSLADEQRMEGYLAWDGGLQSLLPSDHPYKNSPP